MPTIQSPLRRLLSGGDTVYDSASTWDLGKYRLGGGPPRSEVIYERQNPRVHSPVLGNFPAVLGLPLVREDAQLLAADHQRRVAEFLRAMGETRKRAAKATAAAQRRG